ncbi:GNAT family N-acetyltransferase [Thalassospira sp. CH_XMU1448-2]|uniref:GNAT family N-acetyltransferase n=1 Tax=Thalassospira sp. CH_XMU1448-2 TaxID=3107773 RepID=UPI00300BB843
MTNSFVEFSSERLFYTSLQVADIGDLFAFLGDPVAMRFTHCDKTIDDCERRLSAFEARRKSDGFAPWVIRLRQDQRIIGWGGLYIDPFDPDWGQELGYFFNPDFWGQGYATELAKTAIDHARHQTAIPVLTAFAHHENRSSAKLLRRLGFEKLGFVRQMNRDRFSMVLKPV